LEAGGHVLAVLLVLVAAELVERFRVAICYRDRLRLALVRLGLAVHMTI
jgi:hypothetical protein